MAKRENKAYQHLASGGLSGLASAIALQPLDLIKTRLQQGVDVKAGGLASGIKGKGRWVDGVTRLLRWRLAETGGGSGMIERSYRQYGWWYRKKVGEGSGREQSRH
jgi:hypothetical protein